MQLYLGLLYAECDEALEARAMIGTGSTSSYPTFDTCDIVGFSRGRNNSHIQINGPSESRLSIDVAINWTSVACIPATVMAYKHITSTSLRVDLYLHQCT